MLKTILPGLQAGTRPTAGFGAARRKRKGGFFVARRNGTREPSSRFQKKSVSVRSILILMVAVVLIAAGFMLLFIQSNMKRSEREIESLYSRDADAYITEVNKKLDGYFTALNMIGLNQSIRQNIFRTDVTRSQMVELSADLSKRIDEMTFFLYGNGEIRQQNLYTFLPADGHYFAGIQDAPKQPWYWKVQQKSPCWCYVYSNVTGSELLTIASKINAFGSNSPNLSENCYQAVTVDTSVLFSPRDSRFPEENTAVFLFDDDSGRLIYASNPGLKDKTAGLYLRKKDGPADSAPGRIDGGSVQGEDGKNFSVLSRPLASLNATVLFLYKPISSISGGSGGEWIFLQITGEILVAFLLILLSFYSIFSKRFNNLIKRMDNFDERDFSPAEKISGNDEISRIERHLVSMQERIHTLIREEYASELEKIKSQNEALISCINPHFLYNTLNSISAMATMEGANNVVDMVESLSSMFRYSSDTARYFVPIRQEIRNIYDYLHIQSVRYGNSFQYRVEIESALQEQLVPKQILQPVVENVFKHAFHPLPRPGELLISAKEEGGFLILTVRDNGSGIPAETLRELNRSFRGTPEDRKENTSSEIGLWNVNRRIRLIYGDDCGLFLDSRDGEYTLVEIRVLREPPRRFLRSRQAP